jgi:uncharacterized protein YjbI with pentapeptide repeats
MMTRLPASLCGENRSNLSFGCVSSTPEVAAAAPGGVHLGKIGLTGCNLRGASFAGTCLRGAGLAEIEAENARLRNADLRKVSSHLGTTRSGQVGSPIACEGSRTGFYTDDFEELYFKAPEEVRKANLCGADLRGARIRAFRIWV